MVCTDPAGAGHASSHTTLPLPAPAEALEAVSITKGDQQSHRGIQVKWAKSSVQMVLAVKTHKCKCRLPSLPLVYPLFLPYQEFLQQKLLSLIKCWQLYCVVSNRQVVVSGSCIISKPCRHTIATAWQQLHAGHFWRIYIMRLYTKMATVSMAYTSLHYIGVGLGATFAQL